MQEMVATLKKELAATKEELAWYKQREQFENSCIEDIPEESTEYQPLRSLTFGNGVASRVKEHNCSKVN